MILPYPIHLTLTVRVRLAALAMGYLLIGIIGLRHYFYFSLEVVFGLAAMVLNWNGKHKQRSTKVLSACGLIVAILYGYTASKSLLAGSLICSLLSLIQPVAGKPGWVAALSMLLATPIFEYFSKVFSFPIRLALTKFSGCLLTVMNTGIKVEGNMLVNGGTEFSVDAACMGLHMLNLSLLTGLVLIGIRQKKRGLRLAFLPVLIDLVIILGLNIISNLFRIVLLVWFRVPPEAPMHSVIGVACFALYVLLPAQWLVCWSVARFGKKPAVVSGVTDEVFSNGLVWRHLMLLTVAGIMLFRSVAHSPIARLQLGPVQAAGYHAETLPDGIVKLTDKESLIYIKPIAGFYSADHQPGICWSGSGYAFKQVQEKYLAEGFRYTSTLEKDNAMLYSAWWYDDGRSATTSQLEWRWDAFRHSKNYALVNVTATSPAELENEIWKFINHNPCQAMLLN